MDRGWEVEEKRGRGGSLKKGRDSEKVLLKRRARGGGGGGEER